MYLKYNIQLQKYLLSYINSKNDHKDDYNHNPGPKLMFERVSIAAYLNLEGRHEINFLE